MRKGCSSRSLKFTQSGYALIAVGLFLAHTVSYAAEQVAVVIAAEGSASAGSRALSRHSAIYQGETISTAAGGKVAFKFTDGSVVTLKENSSYVIKKLFL